MDIYIYRYIHIWLCLVCFATGRHRGLGPIPTGRPLLYYRKYSALCYAWILQCWRTSSYDVFSCWKSPLGLPDSSSDNEGLHIRTMIRNPHLCLRGTFFSVDPLSPSRCLKPRLLIRIILYFFLYRKLIHDLHNSPPRKSNIRWNVTERTSAGGPVAGYSSGPVSG